MLKRLPLLIAVLALAVWAGNFIIRNFLAAALIAYGREDTSRAAAVAYAPNNAEVLAARGRYLLYRAEPPQPAEASGALQQAALSSPRDYRFWLELGKAYEANGQTTPADAALRRAVELAPRYFETRWALANFWLRTGQTERVLGEFRDAISFSGALYGNIAPPPDRNVTLTAYNTVAGALGMNLDALRQMTPPDAAARAYLAEFLATHDALDEALTVWRDLPADDLPSFRQLVYQLLRALQGKNRFSAAREVWTKWMSAEGVPSDDPLNLITNAGFERPLLSEIHRELDDALSGFDWVLRRHREVRINRSNDAAHTGARSLHLIFAAAMSADLQPLTQLVAVEPGQAYRLRYFVKTKNISSAPADMPFIEITDAHHPSSFTLRSVVPSGTNDWREQVIGFTTLPATHGLRITIRSPQIRTIDLARIAELWLDDFKLEKVN